MNDIEQEEELELTPYIKVRNIAADTFTPFKIKDLSVRGKKYMGVYGIGALSTVGIIVGLDLYALIEDEQSPVVIINVLIPITFSLLSLFKLIAVILHFLLPHFK